MFSDLPLLRVLFVFRERQLSDSMVVWLSQNIFWQICFSTFPGKYGWIIQIHTLWHVEIFVAILELKQCGLELDNTHARIKPTHLCLIFYFIATKTFRSKVSSYHHPSIHSHIDSSIRPSVRSSIHTIVHSAVIHPFCSSSVENLLCHCFTMELCVVSWNFVSSHCSATKIWGDGPREDNRRFSYKHPPTPPQPTSPLFQRLPVESSIGRL